MAVAADVLTEENVTDLISSKILGEKLALYRQWANAQIEYGVCDFKRRLGQ